MTPSKNTRTDDVVGEIRPGRCFLLTGGAGSGKTECALLFADAGLRSGQRVAMVVHAAAAELSAHARRLGVELKRPVADGRLLLLRYRPDLPRRLAQAGSADDVSSDLRRRVLQHRPARLVIDSAAPLLDDASPSAIPAMSIVELLEASQATSLLTYPNDLATSYDRRIEPLVQAATGVLRLVRTAEGTRRVEVVTLRDPSVRLPEPLGAPTSVRPPTSPSASLEVR